MFIQYIYSTYLKKNSFTSMNNFPEVVIKVSFSHFSSKWPKSIRANGHLLLNSEKVSPYTNLMIQCIVYHLLFTKGNCLNLNLSSLHVDIYVYAHIIVIRLVMKFCCSYNYCLDCKMK